MLLIITKKLLSKSTNNYNKNKNNPKYLKV